MIKRYCRCALVIVFFLVLHQGSLQMKQSLPWEGEIIEKNEKSEKSEKSEKRKVAINDLVVRSSGESCATEIHLGDNEAYSISGLEYEIFGDDVTIVLLNLNTGVKIIEEYYSGMSIANQNGGNYAVYAVCNKNGMTEKINISDYILRSSSYPVND